MTISYLHELGLKDTSWFTWTKVVIFGRWRGSVYKSLFLELLGILVLWYSLFAYIESQNDSDQDAISRVVEFVGSYLSGTRTLLSFILVYFYQSAYGRAKTIFMGLPFPDRAFLTISTHVGKDDEKGKLLRQTVARYVLSAIFIIFHTISEGFKREYPDPLPDMVKLGLITKEESDELKSRNELFDSFGELRWVPLVWAEKVVTKAFNDGDWHSSAQGTNTNLVMEDIQSVNGACGGTLFQVYLAFPISLCQVVTTALYIHLITLTISAQNSSLCGGSVCADGGHTPPFFYFPIFLCCEVFVYLGAFRVGQLFIDPLGADADDFEIVQFFNRDLRQAHIYGMYGSQSKSMHMPELTDMTAKQESCLESVPISMYHQDYNRTGVFREDGHLRDELTKLRCGNEGVFDTAAGKAKLASNGLSKVNSTASGQHHYDEELASVKLDMGSAKGHAPLTRQLS